MRSDVEDKIKNLNGTAVVCTFDHPLMYVLLCTRTLTPVTPRKLIINAHFRFLRRPLQLPSYRCTGTGSALTALWPLPVYVHTACARSAPVNGAQLYRYVPTVQYLRYSTSGVQPRLTLDCKGRCPPPPFVGNTMDGKTASHITFIIRRTSSNNNNGAEKGNRFLHLPSSFLDTLSPAQVSALWGVSLMKLKEYSHDMSTGQITQHNPLSFLITSVDTHPSSPAYQVGLRSMDVIVKLYGDTIQSSRQLCQIMRYCDTLIVDILRMETPGERTARLEDEVKNMSTPSFSLPRTQVPISSCSLSSSTQVPLITQRELEAIMSEVQRMCCTRDRKSVV